MAARFTPLDAIKAGYRVDIEALAGDVRRTVGAELETEPSERPDSIQSAIKSGGPHP